MPKIADNRWTGNTDNPLKPILDKTLAAFAEASGDKHYSVIIIIRDPKTEKSAVGVTATPIPILVDLLVGAAAQMIGDEKTSACLNNAILDQTIINGIDPNEKGN